MTAAPRPAALFTAAPRLAKLFESASTSSRWQSGQAAWAACKSRAISSAQPASVLGYVVPPRWLTLRKQPFAVVHEGRVNVELKTARSLSAVGLLYASTIAIVREDPLPTIL